MTAKTFFCEVHGEVHPAYLNCSLCELSEDDMRQLLQDYIKNFSDDRFKDTQMGNQKKAARALGISAPFLFNMLNKNGVHNKRKSITDRVANALGYYRKVTFIKKRDMCPDKEKE